MRFWGEVLDQPECEKHTMFRLLNLVSSYPCLDGGVTMKVLPLGEVAHSKDKLGKRPRGKEASVSTSAPLRLQSN